MKINTITKQIINNTVNNKTINFRSYSADLIRLEQLSSEMEMLHNLDMTNKRNRLEIATNNVCTAKNSVSSLKTYIELQDNNIHKLKQANHSANRALTEFEPNLNELRRKNEEYSRLMEGLSSYEAEQIKELMQMLQRKKDENKVQLDKLTENLKKSIVTEDVLKKEIYKPQKDGLGTVAGFKEIKKQIMTLLGEPIVIEKYQGINKVPGGVLLYGPDETNNAEIALATANQYNCHTVNLSDNNDSNHFFETLDDTLIKAKQRFSNENKRTIVIAENLEKFVPNDTRESGIFKSIMDNMSKKFRTTIIATTCHVENLDNKILRDGRFEKIIVPQLTHDDFIAIIKRFIPLEYSHYSFEKIFKHLENLRNNGAYSVKQVRTLLQSWSGRLKEITIKPEIKDEVLSSFRTHKELILKI